MMNKSISRLVGIYLEWEKKKIVINFHDKDKH